MDDYKIAKKAIQAEGETLQNFIAIEELSELQQAICHKLRGRGDNVAEEIADVRIVLLQLEIMNNCKKESDEIYWQKIKRLARRTADENNISV